MPTSPKHLRRFILACVTLRQTFAEAKRLSILVSAFVREVWTLDLPSLIRAKRAAGREKNLQLIPELESLRDAGESG